MLHVEQKSHAPVINAPTHVVTRSSGFGRTFAGRLVKANLPETRRSELLNGVASARAIFEPFERYGDFDSMARNAADRHPREVAMRDIPRTTFLVAADACVIAVLVFVLI